MAGVRRAGLRRLGWIVGGALVAAFVLWAVLDGWASVRDYDWRLRPGWLALACALILAAYALTGVGYRMLVGRLQPPPPPLLPTVSVWARSLLGRYVPGQVVMLLGRLEMGRALGIGRRTSLAASVYEQVYGLSLAGVAGVLYLIAGFGGGQSGVAWLALGVPLLLLGLHPRVFRPVADRLLQAVRREPLDRHLGTADVARFAAWYALTTALMAAGVWAAVRAAAGDVGSPLEVGGAFMLAVAVSTLVVFLPSGLGLREGIFAVALAQHVAGSVAVSLAAGSRLLLTLLELLFVGIVAFVGRRR